MAKVIKGTDQADLDLQGTAGNDKIDARRGGDFITGGHGNDTIDGGAGIDTAIYSGAFAQYAISLNGHHGGHGCGDTRVSVKDSVVGRDGNDSLKHVELLKFSDAILDLRDDVVHRWDASLTGQEVQGAGQPNPTDPWWGGGGNSLLHYNMSELLDQDIEMGLKFHYRQGADITLDTVDADGTVHYHATAGNQDATHSLVNFDYVINTGLDGSHDTLADFTFKMIIEQKQGAVTRTAVFELDETTHVWTMEGNPAVQFGGDDFRAGTSPSPTVQSQVSENSQNFAFIQGAFAGETLSQMTAAGTQYSITLEAYDHHHLAGVTHDILLLV